MSAKVIPLPGLRKARVKSMLSRWPVAAAAAAAALAAVTAWWSPWFPDPGIVRYGLFVKPVRITEALEQMCEDREGRAHTGIVLRGSSGPPGSGVLHATKGARVSCYGRRGELLWSTEVGH